MVVTLFWSRLREMDERTRARYEEDLGRIKERAENFPGYISHKSYTADDGERITVVTFESAEHLDAWRKDPEHRVVQQRGRESYYEWYRLMTCRKEREHRWPAEKPEAAAGD